MNIGSGSGYPSNALSNFSPHKFILDGVDIASMEGFLQSLKFENVDMQKHVCTLVGIKAKFKGKRKKWWKKQELYWQGKVYKRASEDYIFLIKRAYMTMVIQNKGFRLALIASGDCTFTHTIGKNKIEETVLTEKEFCKCLYEARCLAFSLINQKED